MSALGDPGVLDALATRYDMHGASVSASGRRLKNAAGTARWECQAADEFRGRVAATQATAEQIALEMRALSQQMRVLATEIRQELAALSVVEARVRQALSVWPGGAAPPWSGTAWHPGNLPTSGDPAWRAVAMALGV